LAKLLVCKQNVVLTSSTMQKRLYQLCTLFISLALMSLPVQQAFANDMISGGMNPGKQAASPVQTHCHDAGTHMAATQGITKAVSSTDISAKVCCCDQCDSPCQSDCSSHVVSALIGTQNGFKPPLMASRFLATSIAFSSHTDTPPSPPPLG